jgi:hypothetical protein
VLGLVPASPDFLAGLAKLLPGLLGASFYLFGGTICIPANTSSRGIVSRSVPVARCECQPGHKQ